MILTLKIFGNINTEKISDGICVDQISTPVVINVALNSKYLSL